MIFACPEYYKEFKCIASACRHSCCIGWEIDLDPETACLYKSVQGPLGEKMKCCIAWEAEPHFILGENERCPFLNENNLCEIILELGEESISQICTDHPRFRNYMSERTEVGLGLCCEEAARLIISQEKSFALIEEGQGEYSLDEDYLLDIREEIFEIMSSPESPVSERMEAALSIAEAPKPRGSISRWAEFYLGLERLDEEWTACLEGLLRNAPDDSGLSALMQSREKWFENLFNYFIYRHLFAALDDGDIASKVAFAYLSCRIIAALLVKYGENPGLDAAVEYARMYSSEIEYSDENLGLIFDELRK